MSAIPVKTIEHNLNNPGGRNSAWAPPAKGALQVWATTGGERQAVPTQAPQETEMSNSPQHHCNGAAKRCAICDGKFGLIRHYCWRTALCSRKCADRFKTRQEGDRRWLRRLRAA
jgi:hypothetical protein